MADCRQWIEALPAPQGLLETVQRRGRESLLKQAIPTNSLEAWRLTDLKQIKNLLTRPISSEKDPLNKDHQEQLAKRPNNGLRILLDPWNDHMESIKLPNGIRLLTINELEQSLGQNLNQCSLNNDWQVCLNTASANKILALKVSAQKLPPIELIIKPSSEKWMPTRVLIILEENAELELLQVVLGAQQSVQSNLLEIHLGQEATLKHGLVALGGGNANLLANIAVTQKQRSHYTFTSIQAGWLLSRLEPRIVQLDGQAKTTLRGLQLSSGHEQLATHSLVRFDGPEGYLDQLQKAAATDQSHCIFNGAISVPRNAQRTNASQLSRNLLFTSRARIDTKPELEIIADDVKCAHGATVSQLQEDELFYLRSRGIAAHQATSLLLKGYCQEIINNLPVDASRWAILNQLLQSVKG